MVKEDVKVCVGKAWSEKRVRCGYVAWSKQRLESGCIGVNEDVRVCG